MTHRHNTLQKHKPMYKNLTQQMQPGKNSNSQKISIPTADDLLEPNITNPTQVRQVLTHKYVKHKTYNFELATTPTWPIPTLLSHHTIDNCCFLFLPPWGRDPRTNVTHTLLWLLETFRTSRFIKIPTMVEIKNQNTKLF